MTPQHRFYRDLAGWWPLISPLEEYAGEAAELARLLGTARRPVRDVLELGSGGGHNAAHLSDTFHLTLVDLSPAMLDVSRRHNPRCDHHVGDMRSIRLGRTFDAVYLHDAVDYMTTRADLRRAMATAFVHCRPGGVGVFMPDATTEIFAASTDHGGSDGSDGRGVRYLEWTRDRDPDDETTETDYVFVLRTADDTVEVVHECHRFGLFSRATWIDLLRDVGFTPDRVTERTDEERQPRDVFVGHRPT